MIMLLIDPQFNINILVTNFVVIWLSPNE